MSTKTMGFEGGTNGSAFTTSSPVASGETMYDAVTVSGTGASATFDNTHTKGGSLAMKMVPVASGQNPLTWSSAGTGNPFARRFYLWLDTLPTDDTVFMAVYQGTTGATKSIYLTIGSSGKLKLADSSGSTPIWASTPSVPTGQWVRIELYATSPSTTASTITAAMYSLDSTTALATFTTNTGNTGTTAIGRSAIAKTNLSAYATTFWVDDDKIDDNATGLIGPSGGSVAAPVASFSSANNGATVSFDGTGSTSPGTVTGWAWNFGDTATGTGSTTTHTYTSSGTYNVQLTVTDSNGNTNSLTKAVTVYLPAATATVISVTANAGAFTANTGDITTAMSDNAGSTWVLSPNTPSAATLRMRLAPLIAPAANTDMTLTVEADMTGATNGSITAKLYEGANLRATASTVTATSGTAGSAIATTVTFVFPAASIAAVTNWNNLDVEFGATAS